MSQKNLIIISVIIVVIALLALGVYIGLPDLFQNLTKPAAEVKKEQPRIIEETLVIPETEKIVGGEGRIVEKGVVEVPLVPKSEGEKVIVSKAVLTVKGSHDLALPEAQKWSKDAKLIFIKSLGAVTLEGKSSQWQLVFSSTAKDKKGKGYEIIIQADQIASKKEIESTAVGVDLPSKWMDSDVAIQILQEGPQYSSVSISAINFFYNTDAKAWRYGFSTSIGVTSMQLQ